MDEHLTGKRHKMEKTPLYYQLLKSAKIFDPAAPLEIKKTAFDNAEMPCASQCKEGNSDLDIRTPSKTARRVSENFQSRNMPFQREHKCTSSSSNIVSELKTLVKLFKNFTAKFDTGMHIPNIQPKQLLTQEAKNMKEDLLCSQDPASGPQSNDYGDHGQQPTENTVEENPIDLEDVDSVPTHKYSLRQPNNVNYDLNESFISNDSLYTPTKDYCDENIKEVDCISLGSGLKDIFEKFRIHLTSADGGRQEDHNAKLIAREVERIAFAVKAESSDDLLNASNILDYYLGVFCVRRNLQPSSIQKYLKSLRSFYDFVLTGKIFTEHSYQEITSLRTRCCGWIKLYGKDAKANKWRKDERDLEILVTPEDVQRYMNSDKANQIMRSIKALSNDHQTQLTQSQFCDIRDHLIFNLYFRHSHRNGVYGNARLDSFKSSKMLEGGYYMFLVFEHKTKKSHGAARIYMDEEFYSLMNIYVDKVRPFCDSFNSPYLFLTWGGGKVESCSRVINNVFEKVGVVKPAPITTNSIRKSTVTGIRNAGLGNLEEVASLMTHSMKTADRNYQVIERQKSSLIGCQTVSSYYFQESFSKEKTPTPKKRKLNHMTTPTKKLCDESIDAATIDFSCNEIPDVSEVHQDSNISEPRAVMPNETIMCSPKTIMKKFVNSKRKRRPGKYSDEENERLIRKCLGLLRANSYTESKIKISLADDKMLKVFSVTQIRTRLKYLRDEIIALDKE